MTNQTPTSSTGDAAEEFAYERNELKKLIADFGAQFVVLGDHEYGYDFDTGVSWERHAEGRALTPEDPRIIHEG